MHSYFRVNSLIEDPVPPEFPQSNSLDFIIAGRRYFAVFQEFLLMNHESFLILEYAAE